jgi:glycosyltransferase involved in cell wall biosynthesis
MNADKFIPLNPRLSAFIGGPNYFTASKAGDVRLSIVHVDSGRAFRGGQQALLTLARGLRARGHAQRIVAPAGSALIPQAREEGFEAVAAGNIFALRRSLRGFPIVHAHSGRAQTLVYLAYLGLPTGLPATRVVTRHVAFEPRWPRIHALKYSATCDGIIAVSKAVRRVLVQAGIPEGKIAVIPGGVDLPREIVTPEQRCAARRKYSLATSDFVVGHLGAFSHEKGQDVAIAAAAILRDRLPRLRMILGGEGSPPPLPPGAPVLLAGFVADREEFFAALDLFIMPSRSEGWGLAAVEALVRGIPVLASNTGGLPEIVEAGKTGWLVPPGDAQALAEAIAQAESDPESLRTMAFEARKQSDRFSCNRMAELTELFYLTNYKLSSQYGHGS